MQTLLKALLILVLNFTTILSQNLPDGFVYIKDIIPNIQIDVRYYSSNNFIGDTIDAYHTPDIIISEKAASALKRASKELNKMGYGIKVFDAYRPQSAVDHFVRWAKDLDDTLMKSKHYPGVDKKDLFKEGYIASKSGHSRGSTIDLTLFYLSGQHKGEQLDMGTIFDYFGPKSWPSSNSVTYDQKKNRMILREAMVNNGFKPLEEEWWHFTLKDEPFPKTYFDFPIK